MKFDRPSEPEQGDGDEDRSNVGQGETVFWFGLAVVLLCQTIKDCINARNEEPYSEEKSQAWSEVYETDMKGAETVYVAVDCLELSLETVRSRKDESLITGHGKNARLCKQNKGWSLDRLPKLGLQGLLVFASEIIASSLLHLQFLLPLSEQNRDISFLEEEYHPKIPA